MQCSVSFTLQVCSYDLTKLRYVDFNTSLSSNMPTVFMFNVYLFATIASEFIIKNSQYSQVSRYVPIIHLTGELNICSNRSSMECPRLGLMSRYSFPTSSQLYRSFSTRTFPMNPVPPVMNTFRPLQNSATSDFSTFIIPMEPAPRL